MKFFNHLFAFSFLLFATSLAAQKDCYKKGLEDGKKFYAEGNNKKAIETWEKTKKCRGADDLELDKLILVASDSDGDGVVNDLDKCPFQFGAASKQGCPCFKPLRMEGIDQFYDKFYDEALRNWEEANACEDKPLANDLTNWTARASHLKNTPPVTTAASLSELDDKVNRVVEEMPVFPGGEAEMMKFVFRNIHYPSLARESGVRGTVVVTFVVEKDGFLSHLQILRDPGAGLGLEALRVVEMMPLWTPGNKNGKPVRVQFNLPMNFKLD